MMLSPAIRLLRHIPLLVAGMGLLFVPSCVVGFPKGPESNPQKRAKLIHEYRGVAREHVDRYIQSGYLDIDALQEAIDYERLTTEIAPTGCPSCYRELGKVLSFMGHHYRVSYEEAQADAELEQPDSEKKREFLDEADEYYTEMAHFLRESNTAYASFFFNPEGLLVEPRDVERVMRHHEYLKEYNEAMYYLEKLSGIAYVGVLETQDRDLIRGRIDTLRRYYERRLAKQRARNHRDRQRSRRTVDEDENRRGPSRARQRLRERADELRRRRVAIVSPLFLLTLSISSMSSSSLSSASFP